MIHRYTIGFAAAALSAALAVPAAAQTSMPGHSMSGHSMSGHAMMGSHRNPMVGGAPMLASKNIVQNAMNSKDHTTLVALVKKAGLVATLEGPGPFTVFAPTNEAFAKIPSARLAKVQSNVRLLKKILTYHVVAGKLDSAAIAAKIKAGGGNAKLETVEGESLTAAMQGSKLVLTDAKGGTSTVTIPNVYQSNGVIHVVDTVLMP